MPKRASIAIVIFSVLAAGCGSKPRSQALNAQTPSAGVTDEQQDRIFRHTSQFPNLSELAIAFVQPDQVVYYGVQRRQDTLVTVSNERATFEIGSITKLFTAVLLADLAIHDRISLDDEINAYLPIPLKDDVRITFKQLSNHTSGMPRLPGKFQREDLDPANPYAGYGEGELLDYLQRDLVPSHIPGFTYEYSNVGVALLGYVITRIHGVSYEQLLQSEIFEPLGMSNSTTTRKLVQSSVISGRNSEGKAVPNWDLDIHVAAGGILSTTEDMASFAAAQFDTTNLALNLTRQATFNVNDRLSIGLGWHILRTSSGRALHWHNGGTGGYTSSLAVDPKKKTAIIVLSNVSAFNPSMQEIDKLCFALMDTL